MCSEFIEADLADIIGVHLPLPAFTSDYYREPTDVTRGVTLCIDDAMHVAATGKHDANVDDRFQCTDMPRTLSAETALHLSPTTLCVKELKPASIANSLLDLLEKQMDAHVCKVSRKKFCIKATVFLDGLDCDVKIRLYQDNETCVIEFQRYAGDGLTFWRFYCQVGSYLQSQASCEERIKGE